VSEYTIGSSEMTYTDTPYYSDIGECPRCHGIYPGTKTTSGFVPRPHECHEEDSTNDDA
jgi:hypothetical protein